MKRFRFRLETVERHRKLQEQERQLWLAKCLEKLRSTEKKLLDLDRKEVEARKEFASLGERSDASPAKFWMLDQFIKGQRVRRVDLKQDLAQQEQEVAQAYRDFLKARQQRKIMEKLHEKKREQFDKEQDRHEMHLQDELYTTRARITITPSEESDDEN